jgi:hypothetical protein
MGNIYMHDKDTRCITKQDWISLVENPLRNSKDVLKNRIDSYESNGASDDLPRYFNVHLLRTGKGRIILGREIHATDRNGVVCFGPYVSIKKGKYISRYYISNLNGDGHVKIRLTYNFGQSVITESIYNFKIHNDYKDRVIETSFEIQDDIVHLFECVFEISGADSVIIKGLEILEQRNFITNISKTNIIVREKEAQKKLLSTFPNKKKSIISWLISKFFNN